MEYSPQTVARAKQALRCSPFQLSLFLKMRNQGVSLGSIAGMMGTANQYTQVVLPEITAENRLAWLTEVGLLRREVDGQGLTDSYRLTPLGRQLVEEWQEQSWNQAKLNERVQDFMSRWLRWRLG
jgi:hypothetical protein